MIQWTVLEKQHIGYRGGIRMYTIKISNNGKTFILESNLEGLRKPLGIFDSIERAYEIAQKSFKAWLSKAKLQLKE